MPSFLAAKASLELAEPTYNSYHKVTLKQPLKKNLKKKKKLLKACVDAYTQAANFGVAEITTASTYRIAQIYSEFSKALFASERPKCLNGEELVVDGEILFQDSKVGPERQIIFGAHISNGFLECNY